MKHASLAIDARNVSRSPAGLVIADLALRWDDVGFPDPRWSDFALVVARWWIEAVIRLLGGLEEVVEVRFMEGPYRARVHRSANGSWRLQCVEGGLRQRIRHDVTMEPHAFVQSLLDSSELLLDACRERGWWDADAEQLDASRAQLRQHLDGRAN